MNTVKAASRSAKKGASNNCETSQGEQSELDKRRWEIIEIYLDASPERQEKILELLRMPRHELLEMARHLAGI